MAKTEIVDTKVVFGWPAVRVFICLSIQQSIAHLHIYSTDFIARSPHTWSDQRSGVVRCLNQVSFATVTHLIQPIIPNAFDVHGQWCAWSFLIWTLTTGSAIRVRKWSKCISNVIGAFPQHLSLKNLGEETQRYPIWNSTVVFFSLVWYTHPQETIILHRNFPSLALVLSMIYFSNVGTEPPLPFSSENIFSLHL